MLRNGHVKESLKTVLKNTAAKLGVEIRRKASSERDGVVSFEPRGKNSGRVLLCHSLLPFMLVEGDPIARWREARPLYPSRALIEDSSYGELEPRASSFRPNNRNAAVRGEGCVSDVLEDFARGAAAERDLRQQAALDEDVAALWVRRDCHIAGS